MKVLDVCAGTGSATKAFKDRGHEVETLDISGEQTYNQDVREFVPIKKYDFVWASPPCTCFSIAAVGKHWKKDKTPNVETLEAIDILKSCIKIAQTSRFWVIENPVGMFRTLIREYRKKYYLSTVTYCQYGDTAMKPTDLLHNIDTFHPKRCKNGDKCHTSAPRHTHNTGSTQGKKTLNERYKIPYNLSLEICEAVESLISKKGKDDKYE